MEIIVNELDFIGKSNETIPKQKKEPITQEIAHVELFGEHFTKYLFSDVKTYNFKSWYQCFPNKKVDLTRLMVNEGWIDFFKHVTAQPYYKALNTNLSKFLEEGQDIVPYPELLFNSLNQLPPERVRVVILGQDPYIGIDNNIPEAMGLSFSAPKGYSVPKSLTNIIKNLSQYKHIDREPEGGCLSFWLLQGVLLINSAFTTKIGQSNAHKLEWKMFTTDLIAYLNNNFKNLVFIVWGKDAHLMCLNVDPQKHFITTSSHPSPLGFNQTFIGYEYGLLQDKTSKRKTITYPAFRNTDHFGKTNKYLTDHNYCPILWDTFC